MSKLRNHHPHSRELREQGLLAAELGALGPDVKLDEVPDDVFLYQISCSSAFVQRQV